MAFYFRPFPLVNYDLKKNNNNTVLTNIMTRFKIVESFQRQEAVYYDYSVKEGERADQIAFKFYEDASLDWVIYIVNNVVDPEFDWPLDRTSLESFIAKKYGSVSTAMSQTHHYEQIVAAQSVLFDGTIIPEESYQVDLQTYNTLPAADKKVVTSYEYEIEKNDKKREIKLLSNDFLISLLNQVETIFE